MKEYFDLYNKNRDPLNKTKARGDKIKKNEYYIVVLAILINKNNEILLTKRSYTKPIAPGLWECTAGAVMSGESSLSAVIREIKEETGLSINKTEIEFQKSFIEFNAIFDVWLSKQDFNIKDLELDTEEVDEAQIIPISELKNFITENKVTSSLHEVLTILESLTDLN